MTTLFIDTTYDVTLGLLDDDLKWIDLRFFHGQKSSIILQPEVMSLLKDHSVLPKSLKSVVSVAGPGFYTGLRLSEGFCDVFKFFSVPNFSFYSHHVPVWCGVGQGLWVTKAYRGEFFIHSWKGSISKNEMIATSTLSERLSMSDTIHIHSMSALDDFAKNLIPSPFCTTELLKAEPQKIFQEVLSKKMVQESFYFRPPEDEFKVNP